MRWLLACALCTTAAAKVLELPAFSVSATPQNDAVRVELRFEKGAGPPVNLAFDAESEEEDTILSVDTSASADAGDEVPEITVEVPSDSRAESIEEIRAAVTQGTRKTAGLPIDAKDAIQRLAKHSVDSLRDHLVGCMHHSNRDEFRNHYTLDSAQDAAAAVAAAWMPISQVHAELCAGVLDEKAAVVGLRACIPQLKTAAELQRVYAGLGLGKAPSNKAKLAEAITAKWKETCGVCTLSAPGNVTSANGQPPQCNAVAQTQSNVRSAQVANLRQRVSVDLPPGPADFACDYKTAEDIAEAESEDFKHLMAHADGLQCILNALRTARADSVGDFKAMQIILRSHLDGSIVAGRTEFISTDAGAAPPVGKDGEEYIAQFAKTRTLFKRILRTLFRVS